ncbi:MAG: AprI/Inh family metalloprotease inhibitor [Proteobacteria bacterium]|nr:AprI/Inh family metalloprotease inhibitor [Pseudomonadota bacterium]
MNKLSALTLVAGFALAGTTLAQAADVTAGSYKYTVGSAAPCTLTLGADNAATAAADCSGASQIGKWKSAPGGLQLLSNNGTLIAVLKPAGNAYAGSRTEDGRKVGLAPTTQVGSTQ